MKKRIKNMLLAWMLVICMVAPSIFTITAEASEEAASVTQLDGAISVAFDDITIYRQEGALKAPSAPTDYEDYIFAGWYKDESCVSALSESLVGDKITDENKAAYAKFVPGGILDVKAQIPADTNISTEVSSIRVITTVDSLHYQEVGFGIEIKGYKTSYKTSKVYTRLYAMDESGQKIKSYLPNSVHEESEYFMACTVKNMKNKNFGAGLKVTPYWITLDGTKVEAETVIKTENMGYMSSLAEAYRTEVGRFTQPTDRWTLSTDSNYISAQGGCTDGTYFYQAVICRHPVPIDSDELDTDINESIIQKYSWSEENNKWILDSTSEEVFKMGNANDITYNSKLKLLVICHAGEENAGKNRVSFMDPNTLTLVDPNSIGIEWASGVSVNSEDKYMDCGHAITAIDYNALRDQYVVNMSGAQTFKVLNANFSYTGIISKPTSQTKSYSKQAISSDDGYVYYVFHQENAVAVYDWDGNFVTLIHTDISKELETENISVRDNVMYIVCDNPANSETVMYQMSMGGFASDSSVGTDVFVLNDKAETDFYAETTVAVSSVNTKDASYPRVGLRMTNAEDVNVDFVLNYDSTGLLYTLVATPNASGDGEQQQLYYIDSALGTAADGIKLAVAKTGDRFAFYVNDVLQGTKTFDGFGADAGVIVKLYSKCTESNFSNYRIATTYIEETLNTLHDTFVAHSDDTKVYFDLLSEEDDTNPKVTINEPDWNGSIVNWNGVSASKFYAETTINLTGSNLDDGIAYAGMVLSEGSNRFYILLYGTSSEITLLQCYSMDASDSSGYKNKTRVLNQPISISEGSVTLGIDRDGNSLQILLGDTSYSVDLSNSTEVPHTISGATTVGLTGWGAQATFTNYSFALTSEMSETKDVLILNETASADVYAETRVRVDAVKSGSWPRVGLRLKNTVEDNNVDFILTYSNDGATLLYAQVATKIDGTEVLQTYCIDSVINSVSTDGVKMAVAKRNGVFYFYLNDVLLGTKTFDAFGVDETVTARLYTKLTTSYFSDYNVVTENIEIPMYEPAKTFVADEDKSWIYFDILDEADTTNPQVVTNESNKNWAANSIVNWNEAATTKFLAETKVKLTGSHEAGSGAGIVLTNGDKRFYVMLVGTADGVTGLQCYSTKLDEMSMKVEMNPRKLEYSSTISLTGENKLTVYRVGKDLVICINDEVQTAIDLSKIAYPITGASKVGLAGWRIKATFTDYNIETGSSCPTMDETVMLAANVNSEKYATKNLEILEENIASVNVEMKSASSKDHGYMYFEKTGARLYAETTVDLIDTDGTADGDELRAGITMKNADGDAILAIYLHSTDKIDYIDQLQIANLDAHSRSTAIWPAKKDTYDETKYGKESIEFAILKDGANFVVYINGTVVYQDKLSAYTSYLIEDSEKVHMGLTVFQGSAEFSDYRIATPDETMYLTDTAYSARNVTTEVIFSNENELLTNASITGTSGTHGYMYFKDLGTQLYTETCLNITGTSADQRVGLALKDETTENEIGIYVHAKDTGNPDYLELFNVQKDAGNNGWKRVQVKLTDVGRENIKLAVSRNGDGFTVYINGIAKYTGKLSGTDFATYPLTSGGKTYVGLSVMQGSGYFYEYKLPSPGESVLLAENLSSSNYIEQKEVVFSEDEPKAIIDMKAGSSRDNGYLYFAEATTENYLATTIDFTGTTGEQRAGVVLKKSTGEAIVGVYLHVGRDEKTGATLNHVDKVEIVNLDSHKRDSTIWLNSLYTFSGTNIETEGIKLAVSRNGDNVIVYVNGEKVVSTTLSERTATYPIKATDVVYSGLSVYQGAARFSNFTCTCE